VSGDIVVSGVAKAFGGLKALRDVSFTAREAEITALIGPNGAGKSTLFNLMTGLLEPDSGTIEIGEEVVTGRPPHAIAALGVGRTFQTPRGFPSMSVRDNLTVAVADTSEHLLRSLIGRRRPRSVIADADRVLERIGLRDRADAPYGDLSGGEARLLEVGRQLIRDPRYVLLDEPTAGVAPELQSRLAELLISLRDEGRCLVCVEHNLRFLRRLADTIVVLAHGTIIAAGAPEAVFRDEGVVDAYLGGRKEASA
jgi:ABC-type branched-subunit amino acid transport system ATPase component